MKPILLFQGQTEIKLDGREVLKEGNSVMKHALVEKMEYKLSKQNSTKFLDLHRTFLLEGVPRTYVPTLSHIFAIIF